MNSLNNSFFTKAKVRFFVPLTIILLVSTTLLFSFYKRSDKNSYILQMVLQLTERDHVSPAKMNDQFSEKVFDAYLKQLDPSKEFLTKEDILQLEVYKYQIDDQIKSNSFQLYDHAVALMDKRISDVKGFYTEILSQPLDFSIDESFQADPEKRDYSANNAELKDNWRKQLKLQVIAQIQNALKAQKDESDPEKIKTFETIESEARQRILKQYNDVFMNNLTHQKPEGKFSTYVNAIMSVFDPHTQYNTPTEKEAFDIKISGQFEGIGAQLTPSDGYAKVTRIIPGSPSWRQGELKVNDHIIKVKQENETDPVDIFGMSLDNAVRLIRGKKGTMVTLTVKRGDGSMHEISLIRDIIIDEETYAKSAILTEPANKLKVGYIDLPSFYVDFKRSATGRSCSEDVAEEIEKLKKDDVQGIILDLRTNTGGSLSDVVNMGGLFISTGPIVQVKSNFGSRVYSETDSTIKYNGPLVILVSSVSASASEILAAAMQDYKRAVIIGSPSTFGKGTVQAIYELDEYLFPNMSSYKPMGALTLTIQKYYRINGGSVQLKGVESDIVLPDIYSEWKIGERYEDNYLSWSTVAPAKFNVWKNPVPVEMLKKKSLERTSKSEYFKLLNEQVAYYKNQRENRIISLNLNSYQQAEEKRKEESKRFEELNKQTTSLSITALKIDIAKMEGDTTKIARSEKWIKDLNKDIYLEEAVNVISDMK